MKKLSKKLLLSAALVAALAFALVGCSSGGASSSAASSAGASSSAVASSNEELRFSTGGQSGTYYAFGQVLANHATNNADVNVVALTSDGSKANIEAIEDAQAELGFSQSDVMAYAYNGTNIFEGQPISGFSTVASLYDEQVQIVTCDPEIKSVADLAGKRVSIGAPNSGVYFNAIDILGIYGITENDITATLQNFGDSVDALKNDQLDAAFIVAGAPTTAITDLSATKQAYLVSLDQEHVDQLIEQSPYYVESVIPAGTYAGIDTDTVTVAVSAVIIASNDVSEDAVYAFVSDIFAGADDPSASSAHAKYDELSIEKAGSVTSVPYHPGAAKFFKENNITVFTE